LIGVRVLAADPGAVEGIAVSTHRAGGGDDGFGVSRAIFGDIVRHDIQGGRVVKSTVIYAGKARGACINDAGDKVVFIKLDGHLCVAKIDGTDLKELANTQNHNASAIDWPLGDWVYYSEEGSSPNGGWDAKEKADLPSKKTIRRVNVLTGDDEVVCSVPYKIWQMSLTAGATPHAGRFAITAALFDFSNPSQRLEKRGLRCGTAVSFNGLYITEMMDTHADISICDWDQQAPLRQFHINEWDSKGDGRRFFYRPRWTVNSDRWIVMTHGNDFGATSDNNMVLYNWIDGRQIQVTRNSGGACDEGEDFWLAMINDFAPGGYQGEAPFTVELPTNKLGGAAWALDYGDGAREQTAAPRHTYGKAGTYTITAQHDSRQLQQTVTVSERRPPRGEIVPLDGNQLILRFDEPMQLKNASLATMSGTAVDSLTLDPLARNLRIAFKAPLPKKDTFTLGGVLDQAQQPNAPAKNKFDYVQPAWPANRAGLVFLWESYKGAGFCFNPDRNIFSPVRLNPCGRVTFDRYGAMSLEGGVSFALDGGLGVAARCRAANVFSLQAVITPYNIHQGKPNAARRIIGCNRGGWLEEVNFGLGQEADKLALYIRTQKDKGEPTVQRVELCTLTEGEPNHVVVSYTPGRLECYLNGKLARQTAEVDGALAWDRPPFAMGLNFGGTERDEFPWLGRVEAVAIGDRAIGADEAAADYGAVAALLKKRPRSEGMEFDGKLLAKARVPTLAEIVPYRDALVVHEYQIEKVVKGKYRPKTIRVAHWGLRDAEPTAVTRLGIGESRRLRVEPYGNHPEIEGQALRDVEGDTDRPLYFDVAVGPTGEPEIRRISLRPAELWLPMNGQIQFRASRIDQYGNEIDAPVKWTAVGGGHLDVGTAYSAAQWFPEGKLAGGAAISESGLLTGTGTPGVVTVTATSMTDPSVRGAAIVGIGNYPGVNPASREPLRFGADREGEHGYAGDIDRIRIYNRALSAAQIAEHATGKGLDAAEGLVGDWTFDELKDGAFANSVDTGLVAKVVGDVQALADGAWKYARFGGKGYLEVATNSALDFTTCTLEAWIRPAKGGGGLLVSKSMVWMWGFTFGVKPDGLELDALRTDSGPMGGACAFTPDGWTHVAGVIDFSGHWQLYANGKLVAEQQPHPLVLR